MTQKKNTEKTVSKKKNHYLIHYKTQWDMFAAIFNNDTNVI